MRVLHVFKNYYPPTRGGVEQWVNDVVHSIEGIEFSVLTASTDRRLHIEDDNGIQVVRAPALVRASTAPIVPGWASWMRKLQPDVIHMSMPSPTGELAFLASRTRVPMIASYHGDVVRGGPIPAAYDRFAARFLRRANAIVVGSERLAETTTALRGHADRVVVIPYGVDVEVYRDRPPLADEIRRKLPGSRTGPLAVLLGRLVHYKGADVAIDAMRDPRLADATLLIVGNGPLRASLESRAAGLDRVVFVGEVADDERAAYYHAADVFVFPGTNRGESYGISQVEAMATGTPSISTELGTGTSWVNQHERTGLVVAPRDPRALADAMVELFGDPVKRGAMGAAAQRRVAERLSRRRMLDDLRTLYVQAAKAAQAGQDR
jgi:glycosyltransferase involved in cell wall biosynthesis